MEARLIKNDEYVKNVGQEDEDDIEVELEIIEENNNQ